MFVALDLDSGTTILQHEMPMISFASGGDSDTINFIAYVAKDQLGGRLVHILASKPNNIR